LKVLGKNRLWTASLALTILLALVAPMLTPFPTNVSADGPNMIRNWSFEDGGCRNNNWNPPGLSTSNMSNEWDPWWMSPSTPNTTGDLYIPQYTKMCGDPNPPFKDGIGIQKLHTFYATHDGGFRQRVRGLTPGTAYKFSIWAWGLTRNSDGTTSDCADCNLGKLIGFDPSGGNPPNVENAPSIVWSGEDSRNDQWLQLSVQAVVNSTEVTVYTRSKAKFKVRWNATYWDAAEFVATGPTATPTPSTAPTISLPPAGAEQQDDRYFFQTGYRISDDRVWDYFNKRGGLRTFGYPISRKFRLLGKDVQLFQRRAVEIDPSGNLGQLNLLDPNVMPFNTMNGATFPKSDPAMTSGVPQPGSPGYDTAVVEFIKSRAPESWNGLNTNFLTTFNESVRVEDAFPQGGGSDGMLFGFNIEMWGLPTSAPAADPTNFNFAYLRFQRGIMHFSKDSGVTQGLLIGDYFKAILTGRNLPPDLDQQSNQSMFYKQYLRGAPQSLAKPSLLPNTDLTDAFEAGTTR
jgi:hypothetical protein